VTPASYIRSFLQYATLYWGQPKSKNYTIICIDPNTTAAHCFVAQVELKDWFSDNTRVSSNDAVLLRFGLLHTL
jgi:hypothetical protein